MHEAANAKLRPAKGAIPVLMVNGPLPRRLGLNTLWLNAFLSGPILRLKISKNSQQSERAVLLDANRLFYLIEKDQIFPSIEPE